MILRDDIFAHVALQDDRDLDRTVCLLIILYDLAENARHRERGIVERVYVAKCLSIAVPNVEAARLEIMKVR